METEEVELEELIAVSGQNAHPRLRSSSPIDDDDPPTVDTFDIDTSDFGGTLDGLPYVKPLGDVDDTVVPSVKDLKDD